MFGVSTSSSRNSKNWDSNFLILVEGPTDDINDSFVEPEKNFNIILSNEKQNVAQVFLLTVIIAIFMSKDLLLELFLSHRYFNLKVLIIYFLIS